MPEISRVKRDDHPHWKLVAYMFHTRSGDRVLVDRGDGSRSRAPSVAYAPRAGTTSYWSSSWARRGRARGPTARTGRPIGRGRVRVATLTVPVLARRVDGSGVPERWTLQTNMEGQP